MSSADSSPRFDATAAAQQMLALETEGGLPGLPAQQNASAVGEPIPPEGRLPSS